MNVPSGPARVEMAKMEAERARRRLSSAATALQQRLKPATLADHAWSGVKDRGSELADEAVEVVKARPGAAAGAAAALFLFLARRPIMVGATKLWGQVRKTNDHNGTSTAPTVASAEE